MRRLAFALVSLLAIAAVPTAQTPAPQASSPGSVYQSRTSAILVDVVVRDGKGRPVIDLSAEDFRVFEDGVEQKLGSFTLVNRGTGIGIGVKVRHPSETTVVQTESAGNAIPDEPEEIPGTTALVFDGLSPDGLAMTQKAALEYVPMTGGAGARIGIFATEPSMQVLQPYTTDVALIRKAIRNVSAAGTSAAEQKKQQVASLNKQRDALDSQSERLGGLEATGGAALQGTGAAIGQLSAEMKMVEAKRRLAESFDAMDREHRGFGTATTLLNVVGSMALDPGRKTVVFFSEGLPVSPAMQAQLQRIIEVANRANVTVYAVDAGGLRVISTLEDTRRELNQTGTDRLRQVSLGTESTEGPYTRALEKTEDMLRLDPQGGLARLADDTGGFLVRDTNDIGSAFRRIDEDTRQHYLLTYSPSNDRFDGKFRTIEVRVDRPGVQVFSRKGYRASPSSTLTAAPTYEGPALALLDSGKLPNAFPVRAGGLVFPGADGAIVPVIVKIDTAALQFDIDATKGTYSGQVAVVARIKDEAGNVVQKASQQYVLSGDMKDVDAAKKGEILFYREPRLGAGVYVMETVVYDIAADRASARVSTLTVPGAPGRELELSSVVIVARTEKVESAAPASQAPLYYGDVLLYPNLGEPISRTRDRELAFYVSVYPAADRPVLEARLELLRNGARVAMAALQLATQSTPGGRVQHVGRLPLDQVPPGTYELRIGVGDGATERASSTFFTVSD